MTIIVKMHHQNGNTETGAQFFTFEEYNHFEAETLNDIDKLIETGAFNYEFIEEDGELQKAIFTPKVFENEPKFGYQFIYTIAYSKDEKKRRNEEKEEENQEESKVKKLHGDNGVTFEYKLSRCDQPILMYAYDKNGNNLLDYKNPDQVVNSFHRLYNRLQSDLNAIDEEYKQLHQSK